MPLLPWLIPGLPWWKKLLRGLLEDAHLIGGVGCIATTVPLLPILRYVTQFTTPSDPNHHHLLATHHLLLMRLALSVILGYQPQVRLTQSTGATPLVASKRA